jgi:hypothetical protein
MACNPECPQSFPQWVHLHFKCLKAPSPGLCQALPSATCPVLPLQNGVKFILGHQGRGEDWCWDPHGQHVWNPFGLPRETLA